MSGEKDLHNDTSRGPKDKRTHGPDRKGTDFPFEPKELKPHRAKAIGLFSLQDFAGISPFEMEGNQKVQSAGAV